VIYSPTVNMEPDAQGPQRTSAGPSHVLAVRRMARYSLSTSARLIGTANKRQLQLASRPQQAANQQRKVYSVGMI
jgi:hypothetical protein